MEVGESFVGAYLRVVKGCEVVAYNQRTDEKGDQSEVDVLAFDFDGSRVFACEVATHLGGLLYSRQAGTKRANLAVQVVSKKLRHHKKALATQFPKHQLHLMFWSPYVPAGKVLSGLHRLNGELSDENVSVDLIVNGDYANALLALMERAAKETKQRGESFYRVLQLLTHLRSNDNRRLDIREVGGL